MVALKTQLVPADARYQGTGTNACEYLTIHQTDNFRHGAGAQAHANLQEGGYRGASWHWQVDDKIAIQSYPETAIAWHAGDGGRGPGNLKSIAIEMCVNPDSDYATTFKNAAWLAAQIMKRRNIPMSRLVQHNYWTGKNCPSQIRARNEWQKFRDLVAGHLAATPAPAPAPTPAPKPATSTDRINTAMLPTLRPGSTGLNVRRLQGLLTANGYSVGKYGIDGSWGNDVSKAFRAFQTKNPSTGTNGKPDNSCGPRSWKKLLGI